tara:strand:- start:339 stop:3341 length:3003 start_codon:yes stop_codon:yes gene_type:complete
MTAITQKIRRFTGGISDQPDEQKIPGQVRDAVNCVPDVVQGLIKRPGLNLVNELDTDQNGKWFFIDKANNFNNFDRYVGQISNTTGKVKVWDLENGKLMDVCYTDNIDPLDLRSTPGGVTYNVPEYVTAYDCEGEPGVDPSEDYFTRNDPNIDDLQVLTINDYTFVTNRKVPVQMTKNNEEKMPPQAVAELRSIAGLTTYELRFTEPVDATEAATELSIKSTGYTNAPSSGNCINDSDDTFEDVKAADSDVTSTNGKDLSFRIITSSVVAPVEQDDGTTIDQCVYTTKVILETGGDGWAVGDTIQKTIEGVTHVVTVEEIGISRTQQPIGDNNGVVEATTARENPKADDVLDGLVTGIRELGFTADRIGNSIYMTRDEDFSVTTPNSILLRVLSSTNIGDEDDPNFVIQANDIDQVPLQTKHNLVFFIRNSFLDADDYYVQFKADNEIDGTGTYVETTKPGIDNAFLGDTMPHALLRLSETRRDADNDIIVTFLVASFKWAKRTAGDDNTNPRPSFAPEEGATFGRPINQLAFFRNRFVTMNDENVVCSVAGDFFNFWAKTAQTVSPSDPIDLQVSNNFPAVLFGAQATTAGLLLFSENAQFMLGTENDVLEPRTARTTLLSTYNYNRNSNTVSLGTTVGFVSGIGRYTRFYEMANISRDQEPEVVEQTKVVERLVPGGYNYIGISKDNQLVAMGKRESNEVWMFRYFNTGERRAQSSWVRWLLPGEIVTHALINDSYFTVLRKNSKTFLLRGDVRALQTTIMLDDENDEDYRTFIDYAIAVSEQTDSTPGYVANTRSGVNSDGPYTRVTDITINMADVGFPYFADLKDKDGKSLIRAIVYDPETEEGYINDVTVNPTGTEITIDTQISNQKIFLGYVFDMRIDLPKFYVKKEGQGSVQSWDTANVIIQRVKLNFGRIGYYETTLKRLGRDDYTQIYEAKPMDMYDANELGYQPDYEQTTPIYQRNTTFRMIISSEHPSPAVLYSATWEGQYQENYVKRL